MVTSRIKWMVMASVVVTAVGACIAVAVIFPGLVMAAVVGMVIAAAILPITIAAVFVVVPPNMARVVRDEMGRVTRVLGPGEHIVIPPVERLSEAFSLCWQALMMERAPALDSQCVGMEVSFKLLYTVDPRNIAREWRQAILDSLRDDMTRWQAYLRGIVEEQLQLLTAGRPAESWQEPAERRAFGVWLREGINRRVAGTGIQVQDVQVFWLAPAQPIYESYQDARRRAVMARSWVQMAGALQAAGIADLSSEIHQLRELAISDALANGRAASLHLGTPFGWYPLAGDSGHDRPAGNPAGSAGPAPAPRAEQRIRKPS